MVGFSAVTGSTGIERDREVDDDGDASFVYFAGPEIVLSWETLPNWQLVIADHHRSGGKNVSFLPDFGNIGEASNTNVIGLRYKF